MWNSGIFARGKFGFYVWRLVDVDPVRVDLHRTADRGNPLVVA